MNFAQFLLNAGFNATYDQNVNAYRFQQPVTGRTGTFGTWLSQDLRSSEVGISLSLLAINNESVASEITRRLARENAIHAPVTFKLMACQTGESCKYLLSAYIWLDLARVDEKVFRASVNRLVSVAESTRDLWDSRR
ncbi:MAG TPA: hypothetical protein VGP79_10940 [Bryobacteraceae bacterium]|nr:hypothetical protein [Bryobacteraceae bacterium]